MEQKRFLLALILSAAVLFVWQMFIAPPPVDEDPANGEQAAQTEVEDAEQPSDRADQAAEPAQQDAQAQPDRPQADPEAGAADLDQPADQQVEQRDIEVREDTLANHRFTLELTNEQASIKGAELLEPEQYQAEGDLVGFPEDAQNYPFTTTFLDRNFDYPDDAVFEVVEEESQQREDGTYSRLAYRYQDPRGRFQIDKTYTLDEDLPYTVNMDVSVTNQMSQGTLVDKLVVDIYDWKNPEKESSLLDFRPNEVEGVCYNTEDLERETFDKVVDEPKRFAAGMTQWGAVDTRYFMMGAVPLDGAQRCEMEIVDNDYLRTRLVHQDMSVAPGSSQTYSHQLFVGPKDIDVLNQVGHNLSESVDYGMFSFIARPLRWGLSNLYDILGNWGLAIILLTFIIRGALTPINMKAYSSMERMKEVQPKIKEVREKYEDDKQRMTEETMKIFRENNVSPAGGCLPMLLQMPILYGFFVMIYNSVELYEANFALWYTNLAEPDPYYVLPVMMGVVMFAQQRMSTVDQSNKQAAMMMKIMPVMFTAFMLFLPSGLVLYYALSLLIGVAQQYYVKKKFRTDEAEAS